ncbi:cysteine protease StiP family protein [Bacilliculturomica massiliensis]|uniref:cysteine protease StiP family protein n=1 Tax=Bacilliculturomica massiliensis TaxID=1917867 RepID=UPI0010300471|nr:cysteine protease StiP family protein [Bacilliculturomica massiliensis]
MRSSYLTDDVTFLLKDITGLVEPLPASQREQRIQSGIHYSEMLPLEYRPTSLYMDAYREALFHYSQSTADAVCRAAEKIYARKGAGVVLVSLARAGVPAAILIKHYLKRKYDTDAPHYAVSIIRGRGIDRNAMDYLLARYPAESLQFVDGWTGKGAITRQLSAALESYPGVSPELAVLSDPAGLTDLCGTHEDILIPSSCLNSTVSGLVSRTFLRPDIIGPEDFHGAAYYGELAGEDVSYDFIHSVEACFRFDIDAPALPRGRTGLEEVEEIASRYGIADINFIKPGIGEATRVLLRRVPWRLLIAQGRRKDPRLNHLLRLAHERQVPVEEYPLTNYTACGIIRNLADV